MEVSFTAEQEAFIRQAVASGRYRSPEEKPPHPERIDQAETWQSHRRWRHISAGGRKRPMKWMVARDQSTTTITANTVTHAVATLLKLE
jgi:hypothetical protein